LIFITIQISAEYKVSVENQDLEAGILPVKSAVRTDKPFAVLQNKVIKIQGKLATQKFEEIKSIIANLID
jgi:hypothetical protein